MITLFVHSSSTSAVCNGSSISSSILATASIFKAKQRTSHLHGVKHTQLPLQSRIFPAAPWNLLPTLLLGVAVRTTTALCLAPFTLSSWAGREWWQGMGSAGPVPLPETLCTIHHPVQDPDTAPETGPGAETFNTKDSNALQTPEGLSQLCILPQNFLLP